MLIGLLAPGLLMSLNLPDQERPVQEQPDIVVTGERSREAEVNSFVRALTPAAPSRRIARFEQAICPAAVGLGEAADRAVIERMRRVVEAAGLRAETGDCAPNVVLIVTRDKPGFLRRLSRQRPEYFGEIGLGRVRELIRDRGPAVAWHIAGAPMSARGQELGVDPSLGQYVNRTTEGSSRLAFAARPQFESAVVVIERGALSGLTMTEIADYAIMRALVDAEPERLATSAPTILRILDAPMSSEVPITLTEWDLGFLRAFYSIPRNAMNAAQRSAIREQMLRELDQDRGAAAAEHGSPPAPPPDAPR